MLAKRKDDLNKKQIAINVPVTTTLLGSSVKINIPNDVSFKEITLVYNAPALTGGAVGSYIPNSIYNRLQIVQNGMPSIILISDVNAGIAPYGIQMHRESNQMNNGIGDTAEYLVIKFPTLQSGRQNSYIDILLNSITNIQTRTTGDRTTLTAGTINCWIKCTNRFPTRETKILKNCGILRLSTLLGRLSEFINPTQDGYIARTLMLYVEDNYGASNSAVDAIELWKGAEQLINDKYVGLQENNKADSKIAHNTGFLKLTINKVIKPFELQLFTIKEAAGTDVRVYWMLTSSKKIR